MTIGLKYSLREFTHKYGLDEKYQTKLRKNDLSRETSHADRFVSKHAHTNLDLCGKHYGQRMLQTAYDISKELYPNRPLYLEVRTWNMRAVKCYEKAGFRIAGEPYELTTGIGTGCFFRMVKA